MNVEERDDLFRLVMQYHDGELPPEQRDEVRALIQQDPEAQRWIADMESMGDATFEFVRDAIEEEDFSQYWVTVDEGVRSPTPALRRRKRERDRGGLGGWLQRTFGTWLVPAGGLAVAGAAALLVLAVMLPSGNGDTPEESSIADWEGLSTVNKDLEIDAIEGDDWSVSIMAVSDDQPMIVWLDDLSAEGEQG